MLALFVFAATCISLLVLRTPWTPFYVDQYAFPGYLICNFLLSIFIQDKVCSQVKGSPYKNHLIIILLLIIIMPCNTHPLILDYLPYFTSETAGNNTCCCKVSVNYLSFWLFFIDKVQNQNQYLATWGIWPSAANDITNYHLYNL